MENFNLLLATDSYKVSHSKQYPAGTENVYSYFESRGGQFKEVTFFGLQYILTRYLEGRVVTAEKIDEAEKFIEKHLGDKKLFNRAGWEHILNKHDGRLPIRIKAVAEGKTIPVSNVMMTVENTDPECYWLTNYLETLLVQVWYPSTVATLSREMKKIILNFLNKTGTPELVNFKLHDFGFRGVSSYESAAIGGAAHLVNFMGTDTMAGLILAKEYYAEDMAGFSIPAAEHSTITSHGMDKEAEAYKNMLEQFPTGLVAVVSDSYNLYKACSDIWGKELKNMVLERDGVLIVRPDSGNPPEVVVKVLNLLGEEFGYTVNEKGYKVLNPKIRVIQGDGIDYDMVGEIFAAMENEKWSGDNIAFGMGGALLQKLNRDTQMFAFKCSSVTVNGIERDVFKNPVTCDWKKSKAGKLMLVEKFGGGYITQKKSICGIDCLETVFVNGTVIRKQTLQEIRELAKIQ